MHGKYMEVFDRPSNHSLHRQSMGIAILTIVAAFSALVTMITCRLQEWDVPYFTLIALLWGWVALQGLAEFRQHWREPLRSSRAYGNSRREIEIPSLHRDSSEVSSKSKAPAKKSSAKRAHVSKSGSKGAARLSGLSSKNIKGGSPRAESRQKGGYFPPEVSFKLSANHPIPPKPAPVS